MVKAIGKFLIIDACPTLILLIHPGILGSHSLHGAASQYCSIQHATPPAYAELGPFLLLTNVEASFFSLALFPPMRMVGSIPYGAWIPLEILLQLLLTRKVILEHCFPLIPIFKKIYHNSPYSISCSFAFEYNSTPF
jgi:hypothetical protein